MTAEFAEPSGPLSLLASPRFDATAARRPDQGGFAQKPGIVRIVALKHAAIRRHASRITVRPAALIMWIGLADAGPKPA